MAQTQILVKAKSLLTLNLPIHHFSLASKVNFASVIDASLSKQMLTFSENSTKVFAVSLCLLMPPPPSTFYQASTFNVLLTIILKSTNTLTGLQIAAATRVVKMRVGICNCIVTKDCDIRLWQQIVKSEKNLRQSWKDRNQTNGAMKSHSA